MSSSSDEDTGDDTTIGYNDFRKGFQGKQRKDGKPFNEGNILYAYRFQHRTPKASTPRKRSRKEDRKESENQTTGKREREEDEQVESRPGPSKRQTSEASIGDWFFQGNEEGVDDVDMATAGDNIVREKRGVPTGSSNALSSSAVTAGSGAISYIEAAKSGEAHFSFEHTHLLNTWGNAYKITTLGTNFETKCMMTSLSCVPVQAVCFWMSYAEYRSLPPGTRITSVECIVIPKGFKTSFDTGTTVTASANNTQGVFGQVGVGLNLHLLARNFDITRNATKPMIIDSIKVPDVHDITERLWGYEKFEDDKFNASIPTCVGIPRSLKVYLGLLMPYKAKDHRNKEINTGWPDMMKCTKSFNFLDHIEKPVVHYKYDVKTNVLVPKKTQVILDDTTVHKCVMGGEDISICAGQSSTDNFTMSKVTKYNSVGPTGGTYQDYIAEIVEQCHSVTILNHTPPNSGQPQPSLHIGILPIQSNAPDKELQDYVTCCGTWEIKTCIHLATNFHQHYTFDNINAPRDIPWGKRYTGVQPIYHNSVHGFAPIP